MGLSHRDALGIVITMRLSYFNVELRVPQVDSQLLLMTAQSCLTELEMKAQKG